MALWFKFQSTEHAKAFAREVTELSVIPNTNGSFLAVQGDDLSLENGMADPYSTEVSVSRCDSAKDEDRVVQIAAKHGGCFVGTVR